MNQLAQLLGSSTRANIVEALAKAEKPLSAYRISKSYGMNFARVYIEMKRLANLGLVRARGGRRGQEYVLLDENLRALASKLSSRVVTFEAWNSPEARATRFRNGQSKVPKFYLGQAKSLYKKPTRLPGELDTLAILARNRFDRKYRRVGEREYARV